MSQPYYTFDQRRKILIPGVHDLTIAVAAELWIEIAKNSIQDHDFFAVALSGGSTPKKIFQKLSTLENALDWTKVYLFWSDERAVLPTDPESNYQMAMNEGFLSNLPIPKHQIFRMVAEENIAINAAAYEEIILNKLGSRPFDLVMLGMGEDGHTASLFPHTEALKIKNQLVAANYVPQKKCWRMTLTYECINSARHICILALGASKADILEKVLLGALKSEEYPIQLVGTETNPALLILDSDAAKNLAAHLK